MDEKVAVPLPPGTPRRGWRRTLACLGIFAGWFAAQILVLAPLVVRPSLTSEAGRIVLMQAAGIAWVGAWYRYMRKREPAQAAARSEVLRVTRIMAILVVAVYLLTWLYESLAGIPSEDFMRSLFAGQPAIDVLLMLIAVFIMAPVGEELAFRYFLFEAMPYRRGGWYAVGSVVAVTAAFAAIHVQYKHVSTFVALVLIGAIFTCARLFTGRLYPSVLLHALTAVLALVIQYVDGYD